MNAVCLCRPGCRLARGQQSGAGQSRVREWLHTKTTGTPAMDLQVPIALSIEQTDEVIAGRGVLDLGSGEIRKVEYTDWDVAERGHPWDHADYEFTSGTLSHGGKDVEFGVEVNRTTGQFSVNANELLEIKLKAAQLFAGMSGADLLASATARKH
jgi:hypothetical protein